jgi:hypothetical protein
VRCENGQTQETTRGFDSGYIFDKRAGLGIVQSSGSKHGYGQIDSDPSDSARENTLGATSQSGETTDGKILERLEFIENAYLSYVQSHQRRLEERLVDSKEQEVVFKEAIQALKQEIHNLASGLDK